METSESSRAKTRRDQPTKANVLVVEDETDLQDLLRYHLEREGYRVATAASGERALELARSSPPDLVVLDLMLPGIDGLEVCRRIKADAALASSMVLMLTAKSEEADVVAGLELGADDYVTKPFSPRVLLSRVRAALRRRTSSDAPADRDGDEPALERGELIIRPDRHEVTVSGKVVDLTATEFKVLKLLAARPGRVFTRQQIIDGIHESQAAVTDRSVDVQVLMLRRKLGAAGDLVQTVRGVGYRFKDEG